MAIPYPLNLRTITTSGKSRTQPASFKTHEPRRGYAYFQKIGTDTPVFWSVSFTFTREEAKRFWLWFASPDYLDSGAKEFTMPIKTEFGMVTHTCRFLPDSLLPVSETAEILSYSATIMARALVYPPGSMNLASFIVDQSDYLNEPWLRILDIGMSQDWPA